jgi:hypothetical protein
VKNAGYVAAKARQDGGARRRAGATSFAGGWQTRATPKVILQDAFYQLVEANKAERVAEAGST